MVKTTKTVERYDGDGKLIERIVTTETNEEINVEKRANPWDWNKFPFGPVVCKL